MLSKFIIALHQKYKNAPINTLIAGFIPKNISATGTTTKNNKTIKNDFSLPRSFNAYITKAIIIKTIIKASNGPAIKGELYQAILNPFFKIISKFKAKFARNIKKWKN